MYYVTYNYREHECLSWPEARDTYRGYCYAEMKRRKAEPTYRADFPTVTSEHRDDERDGLTDDERAELDDIFSDLTEIHR